MPVLPKLPGRQLCSLPAVLLNTYIYILLVPCHLPLAAGITGRSRRKLVTYAQLISLNIQLGIRIISANTDIPIASQYADWRIKNLAIIIITDKLQVSSCILPRLLRAVGPYRSSRKGLIVIARLA